MNLEDEGFDFWYHGNRFAINATIWLYIISGLASIIGAIVLLVKTFYFPALSCLIGAFFLFLLSWAFSSLKKTQIVVDCLIKMVNELAEQNEKTKKKTDKPKDFFIELEKENAK